MSLKFTLCLKDQLMHIPSLSFNELCISSFKESKYLFIADLLEWMKLLADGQAALQLMLMSLYWIYIPWRSTHCFSIIRQAH